MLTQRVSIIFPHKILSKKAMKIPQVLILDDDRIQHILLQKRFSQFEPQPQVTFFERAVFALDFLKENSADMILLDLNLPEMDGWEFVNELKKLETKGKVFVLSGSIDPKEKNLINEDPFIKGQFEKPLSQLDLEMMMEH